MTQRPFYLRPLRGRPDPDSARRGGRAASIELRDLLRAITADLVGELRINLTDVDFLPSVAIGVLAGARNAAAKNDASVTFVAADGSISRRVLTICGIACDED